MTHYVNWRGSIPDHLRNSADFLRDFELENLEFVQMLKDEPFLAVLADLRADSQ